MHNTSSQHRLEQCQKALDKLLSESASEFDPARFCQLESTLRRCSNQRQSVVEPKLISLLQAITDYRSDYELALEESALLADQLDYQFPESREKIHTLFEQKRFTELRRLAERLRQSKRFQEGNLAKLKELRRQLEEFGVSAQAEDPSSSFEQQLRQQEAETLAALNDNVTESPKAQKPFEESHAIKLFKSAKEKQYIDDIVSQAMREKPENPGPINPHMLAIRSLSMMLELSPAYLSKFVQTMDTLFFLEQAKQGLPRRSD